MVDATESKLEWEDQMWDSYNFLMKCPDVSRLQKLLARTELFKMSLEIPGKFILRYYEHGKGLTCRAIKLL